MAVYFEPLEEVGRPSKIPKNAPLGQYRVITYNPLADEEKFLGDHHSFSRAVEIAKDGAIKEGANAFVYDHDGNCIWSYLYFK